MYSHLEYKSFAANNMKYFHISGVSRLKRPGHPVRRSLQPTDSVRWLERRGHPVRRHLQPRDTVYQLERPGHAIRLHSLPRDRVHRLFIFIHLFNAFI